MNVRGYIPANKAANIDSLRMNIKVNEKGDLPFRDAIQQFVTQNNADASRTPLTVDQVSTNLTQKLAGANVGHNPSSIKLSVEDAQLLFHAEVVTDNNGHRDGQNSVVKAQQTVTSSNSNTIDTRFR